LPDNASSEGLKKLLAAIDEEAERLLRAHHIYDVLSYGWSGPDTPNDEYVGLAMWSTQPPFEPDWEALTSEGKPVTYAPTKSDEVLLRNGEDFVGTMEFARHSLGLALCYSCIENQKYNIFGRAPFWHAIATGLLWLNIASDRLRDYFLMARFGQNAKAYSKSYKNKNQTKEAPSFAAPFEDALKSATPDNLEILTNVVHLAKKLRAYRSDRNVIVHEVASKSAAASIDALREQRELAKSGKPVQFATFNYEEALAADAADTTVASAIERMKSWYGDLVKTSSLAFEFEYRSRRHTS
jgi:hypothetical protein